MDSGLYAAYSGLLARTQALDLAANNLANTGTNGFRAGRESFGDLLKLGHGEQPSQVGDAINDFGVLGAAGLSSSEGKIAPTGNPLDVAIQGEGFFSIMTKAGVRYTRDGSFQLASDGKLQTSDGSNVLDANGKPITLPAGDVRISPDGTVSVTNSDGNAIVGKIAVVDLGAGGAVAAEGANIYRAASGATPTAANATLQQGSIEGSNQDAITGSMQLMLLGRQAEMMQRALSVFHNDLNKTAAEDLSRVA